MSWLPIQEANGYEVSDLGQVRSVARMLMNAEGVSRAWRGRLLTPWADKNGRLSVGLGRGRRHRVGELVLSAFVGPRPEGLEVCHRNDDQSDNRLSNLYWGTRSQNESDKVRNGGHHQSSKVRCPKGHRYTPDNTLDEGDGRRRCRICRTSQKKGGGRG
jgi:hypothetical protein